MQELKKISISDVEALALITGLLVVIIFLKLKEKSIVLFYDIIPMVGWVRRLASRSKRVARLMRILAILIKIANIALLIITSIQESLNKEADYTTKYIHENEHLLLDTEFLITFNLQLYIKQGCNFVRLSQKITLILMSEVAAIQDRLMASTSTERFKYWQL